MPLKLDFKSGEKMVINGAVLENVGPNAKILVHNQATILREKEVLTENNCATPASRVYFALQCAYMFPEKADEYMDLFETHLTDYTGACPSAIGIAEDIRKHVNSDNLYKGLKSAQVLIEHEVNILNSFQHDISEIDEPALEDGTG